MVKARSNPRAKQKRTRGHHYAAVAVSKLSTEQHEEAERRGQIKEGADGAGYILVKIADKQPAAAAELPSV